MLRLEHIKMNAELLICFIDFWELAWNTFLIGLYTFNKSPHASEYPIATYMLSHHIVSLSKTLRDHCSGTARISSLSSTPSNRSGQVRSCHSAVSGPSGRSHSGPQSRVRYSVNPSRSKRETECYYPQQAGSNCLDWGRINNTNTGRAAQIISI